MEEERDARQARVEDRQECWAAAREARLAGRNIPASGQFGAGASASELAALLASDDEGREGRGAGRTGPSAFARNILSRLGKTGEVEEFAGAGAGGMFAGVRGQAEERLKGEEQRDLMRRSVDIQEQIRDLLRQNLEAA
jgi:hypothetical protein